MNPATDPRPLDLAIDGIGVWAPGLPGWDEARQRLIAGLGLQDPPAPRPSPEGLGPNERRRAPDAVLLALEAGQQATAAVAAQRPTLASVFCSAHGDLATVDALCHTLAADPLALSPTRFHHSVHNAAAGYWAIAHGATAPSTALAAYQDSFAAGLLEAAAQCAADQRPVLLVGVDTPARGPLASVHDDAGLLALALLLSPAAGSASLATLQLTPRPGGSAAPVLHSVAGQALPTGPMRRARPRFEALAGVGTTPLALPLGETLHLALAIRPTGLGGRTQA